MKGEEKLQALRKEMQSRKYDAYIIPHGDQHDVLFIITFYSFYYRTNTLQRRTKE